MNDLKIGLGLSGGGFRASIFHLGVILRLEELGIMPQVKVISSVSGGSIIAAFYVIEMERRLGEKRREIEAGRSLTEVRVEIFHKIACDFFSATDHNLRSRALVFLPFYHPVATLKMLSRNYNRSDVMQEEYDKWFYRKNTLDQLPSVVEGAEGNIKSYLVGPKLMLNTASLLTGERVTFSRISISGMNELSRVNKNILPLSRVVGASAGVPVLFPPTYVSGDMLVDGGVTDNQGLEALWEEEQERNFDVLLVSDASGQMEQVHQMSSGGLKVLARSNSIFQFQIRKKLLNQLILWREKDRDQREFAFIHLYLNLKDRPDVKCRVPSEYISPLARIRTDLDQFSFVEREALMYHGYTLMDGQLKKYCTNLIDEARASDSARNAVEKLSVPLLFKRQEESYGADEMLKKREKIKKILKAGSQSVFLLRSVMQYPAKALAVIGLSWAVPLIIFFALIYRHIDRFAQEIVQGMIGGWLAELVPGRLEWLWHRLNCCIASPITLRGATILVTFLVLGYLLVFLTYLIMRRLVRAWNLAVYRDLTGGSDPSGIWLSYSDGAPDEKQEQGDVT
jgi:predicted acylesterase/phospholipase RssA